MIHVLRVVRTPLTVRIVRTETTLELRRAAQTVRIVSSSTGVPGPPGPTGPLFPIDWGPVAPLNPDIGDIWLETT